MNTIYSINSNKKIMINSGNINTINYKNSNSQQNKILSIPNTKSNHQRSSSIPINKILSTNQNNILKASRESSRESRERFRPASRNLKNLSNLNEARTEQAAKLEEDIYKLDKENSLLIKRNNDFELYFETLRNKLEKLSFNVKEAKDNIINALRLRTSLINKHNKIQKEIEFSQREFEMFRIIKEYKINTVSNNIQYAKNIKEDRKNSFAKKIETEMLNKINLEKDLRETKNKIKKMRFSLADIQNKRNKSADKILKEKCDMERFLIDL